MRLPLPPRQVNRVVWEEGMFLAPHHFQAQRQHFEETLGHTTFNTNGSGAKSEGVELSLESRPIKGLALSGWVTYDNAVLTQNLLATTPPTYGVAGDRLPLSSRVSGNISAEEQFPITDNWNGFVGAQLSYVGDRLGLFQSTPVRQDYPGYAKTDIRGGVQSDTWKVNLFVNNVADRRGELAGGLGLFPPWGFTYITPRTVGISLEKTF